MSTSDPFSEFYTAYPKKVARAAARKAWERVSRTEPDLLSLCLDALSWQTRSEQWVKDGGQFVPYPATYLNQERYADENPVVTAQAKRAAEADAERQWAARRRQIADEQEEAFQAAHGRKA